MDALEEVAVQAPNRITPLAYDVTDVAAAEGLVHRLLRRHGRLDVWSTTPAAGRSAHSKSTDTMQLHPAGFGDHGQVVADIVDDLRGLVTLGAECPSYCSRRTP